MAIDVTGKVGIGTTAPDYGLHVKQFTSNRAIKIEHHSATDYWTFGVGASTKNFKFFYNGATKADILATTGAYSQLSDRMLKKNIEPLGSVLAKVMKLKPSIYHYIDNEDTTPKSIGFIAQDVELIFPDLVQELEGNKALVYDNFAVLAIATIQEQQKLIDDLRARQKKFEEELESIRREINSSGK